MGIDLSNEFDLLEGIRKIEKVENPYKRFLLNGNPFPKSATADLTSESFYSRCRTSVLTKVKEFLIYSYTSQYFSHN